MKNHLNTTAAFENKVRESQPQEGSRDARSRSRTRSLVLLFVIVLVAVTVRDLRMPKADKAQAAFCDEVYRQMDGLREELWLGNASAEWLLTQPGWITETNADPDIRRAVKRLLQQDAATIYDWGAIKLETAGNLWDLWQTSGAQGEASAFIRSQLEERKADKTLPGLGESLWIINETHLLAAVGDLWGICPLADLKYLD